MFTGDENPFEEMENAGSLLEPMNKPTKRRQRTFAFDKKLIEATKRREIIYNPANKSNRYVELKERAWIQIALELGVPVKKCKARWASLRDRFRRITKIQQHALKNGMKINNRWRYYKPLSFLAENPINNSYDNFEDFSILPDFEVETMFSIEPLQKVDCASNPTKMEMLEETDPINEFEVKEEPVKTVYDEYDPTRLFFMSLARRIKAVNLPSLAQMRLEADILNFTINQIEETRAKRVNKCRKYPETF